MKNITLVKCLIFFTLCTSVHNTASATNPISFETYAMQSILENGSKRSDHKSEKSNTKKRFQKFVASKLSKYSLIVSGISVLLFASIFVLPSSPLFLIVLSWILAATGVIGGILALLRSRGLSGANKKRSRKRAWWAIFMPIIGYVLYFVYLVIYWSYIF